VELCRLSTHCEFDDHLEDALQDRLVCGLHDEAVQWRLLTQEGIDLCKAFEIAQAMEAAERKAQQLKGPVTPIQLVSGSPPVQRGESALPQIWRREPHCTGMPLQGSYLIHVARKGTLARPATPETGDRKKYRAQGERLSAVRSGCNWNQGPVELRFRLHSTSAEIVSSDWSPLTVHVQANGKSLTMELDTGAAVSVISKDAQRRLFPDAALKRKSVVLRTCTSEPIRVEGQLDVEVQYSSQKCTLPLVVVAGKGPPLLGRKWLQYIQLDWKTIGLGAVNKGQAHVQSLLHRYCEVFGGSLGTMRHFIAKLEVKNSASSLCSQGILRNGTGPT